MIHLREDESLVNFQGIQDLSGEACPLVGIKKSGTHGKISSAILNGMILD